MQNLLCQSCQGECGHVQALFFGIERFGVIGWYQKGVGGYTARPQGNVVPETDTEGRLVWIEPGRRRTLRQEKTIIFLLYDDATPFDDSPMTLFRRINQQGTAELERSADAVEVERKINGRDYEMVSWFHACIIAG